MDSQLLLILAVVFGLSAGLALGWVLGSRPVAEWRTRHDERQAEARDLDEKFKAAIRDLAGASERAARADELAATLEAARNAHGDAIDALRRENADFRAKLATLEANAANFAEQQRLLVEARETLVKEFQLTGSKVLEGAQEAFIARASERFGSAEKSNEARIKALLEPVGVKLDSYEKQVRELEAQRIDAFGNLAGLIEGMRVGQEQIRVEAQRLGSSLRNAPKSRGRWGEQQLRNVLEQCGLAEHSDFITEHSVDGEDGRLRPDAIVRVPGNKMLVIDAKVSLNDYQDAFEAQDDVTRDACLERHVASMRNHIQTLAAKSYQSQFEEAPDYVLMFVPGEHFISAALEYEARIRSTLKDDELLRRPDLWNYAFDRRVLLASPTNLVAIARTVAQVWRQDGLAKEAREIGRMGGELYDRLAVAAEHLRRVGGGLGSAVENYNKFVGSFERNVLSAGRRLKDKHIEIGKREIEDVPLVEAAPRYTAGDILPEPATAPAIDAVNDGAIRDTG